MLEKVDVREIVAGHFRTFQDHGNKTTKVSDFVLFLGVPSLLTAWAAWRGFALSVNAVNALLTAFSIFAGLLFNLLVMVLTFLQSTPGNNSERRIAVRRDLLRQITANLSFAILTAIVIVTVAIVSLAQPGERVSVTLGVALLWGAINFGLTLLMILRRMYALMLNDLDNQKINKAA